MHAYCELARPTGHRPFVDGGPAFAGGSALGPKAFCGGSALGPTVQGPAFGGSALGPKAFDAGSALGPKAYGGGPAFGGGSALGPSVQGPAFGGSALGPKSFDVGSALGPVFSEGSALGPQAQEGSSAETLPGLQRVRLKVVVFGAPRVGKSSLVRQFLQKDGDLLPQQVYLPTRRREVHYPVAFTNRSIYELEVIDTCTMNISNLFAYAKRNLSLPSANKDTECDSSCCNAAVCYLLVYDATSMESFFFIQRVRHHLLTLLSSVLGSGSAVQQQSFDGDSVTQASSADVDGGNAEPVDCASSLGYRNGRYVSMIVAANKFDARQSALCLDMAALSAQLPHSTSANHLHRSRSLLRHRLRQLRELTGRGDKDNHKDKEHHLHPHGTHPSFTLSHPNGVEQCMSVSSSSTSQSQSQNVSTNRLLSQTAQPLDEYVRKCWRLVHVDVSARSNYHVSLLFREIIRDFELRQADQRNNLLHAHSSRFESALRSRFGKKQPADAVCALL